MTRTPIDDAARLSFDDHDPVLVVAAVGELVPLGRDAALRRIREVAADVPPAPDAVGLMWVLRTLFDVPADVGHAPLDLGDPDVPPPPGNSLPRFPIVLVQDVPLLVVRGYVLAGFPGSVADNADFYEEHGRIRAAPLAPEPDGLREAFHRVWGEAYPGGPPPVDDVVAAQFARMGA
jgi:hypothetical protein